MVALLDIKAHRCLVPFAAQPQVICSIALRNVLLSTTFGWSGAVGVPFHPRLSLSEFDTHGSSTLSPSVTLQLLFTLMWLQLGRPVRALSLSFSHSPLCSFLCVVDVAAVSPASGLPQHLLWMVFPAVLPCLRASTALAVGCSQLTSFAQL